MKNYHPALIPLDPRFDPNIDPENDDLNTDPGYNNEFIKHSYQSGVGSLQFLGNQTRPDLAATADFLARYNIKPNQQCWRAFKYALRYLNNSRKLGITFKQNEALEPLAYAD